MKQLNIKIQGIVQGMTLRARINIMAKQLNLKGYVENKDDGTVSVVAQGRESALEEFLSWIQRNSFPAKITGMSYSWEEITTEFDTFKVKKNISFIKDQAKSLLNLGKNVMHYNESKINVPKHVVIIPDGNRRWARQQGWHAWIGHRKAVAKDKLMKLLYECADTGVEYLSFWAFSTENWTRDEKEIGAILDILNKTIDSVNDEIIKNQIRFRYMGRRDRVPNDILEKISKLEKDTEKFNKLNFQLCFDYNGRDDIVRAVRKLVNDNVDVNDIDEKKISAYLDSGLDIPDPDLVIRTSGERRTSGIMAYQAAYAELYFTNVYFPDFDSEQFKLAILDYSARTRRFGGTVKSDIKEIDIERLSDPDMPNDDNIKHDNNLAV